MAGTASAVAHSNIALAKYWGKRDHQLNLPAVGSISLTLTGLSTRTWIDFVPALPDDEVIENSRKASPAFSARVSAFLDILRRRAETDVRARVETTNNFPTGAGLASSASGFAALTLAGSAALKLPLNTPALSRLARLGSGSAARSIIGGFAEWHRGRRDDGEDSYAEPLAPRDHWDLRMVIAVVSKGAKAQSSRDGMTLTREKSPYYPAWVATSETSLATMRKAILARNFTRVGELTEASAFAMHAVMLSAGLIYWKPATVAVIDGIRALRRQGTECYLTIDAGPQVKVLCQACDAKDLENQIRSISGVQRTLICMPGPGASLIGTEASQGRAR